MAQDTFERKLTPILSVENTKTELKSRILKRFILLGTTAALIVAGIHITWQQNLFVKPARAEMPNEEIKCSGQNVVVRSLYFADARIACEGARDAIDFLESYNLDIPDHIEIDIVTSLPADTSFSASGCYIKSEPRVRILVYSEFKKFETWFGVHGPRDSSQYRSLVSHEVAHKVADLNFTISKPSFLAQEYIAYITQLSTMQPELRDRVLENFSGEAFEGDWQMSPIIYMFDPMNFGIRAYLHFLNLIDGDEYIHLILNGEALLDISHLF